MSVELYDQQIQGLKAKITELREQDRILTKAQGIDEEIEKTNQEMQEIEKQGKEKKEELDNFKSQRSEAVSKTAEQLKQYMDVFLPYGECELRIENGTVLLGWKKNGKLTPQEALSGGERVIFDEALSNALLADAEEKLLVVEAGELDNDHLQHMIEQTQNLDSNIQLLINTCHEPYSAENINIERL